MATASVTNTLVNGSTPDASIWNTNYSDLVTFLNTQVLHRDGSKTLTGDLDFNGYSPLNAAFEVYDSGTPSATVLTAGVGTYQNVDSVTLPDAGTYYIVTNGFIESIALTADVSFTARLTRDSDTSQLAVVRTRQLGALSGSATWLSQLAPQGIITTSTANDICRVMVARDGTAGTQTYKDARIMAFRVA